MLTNQTVARSYQYPAPDANGTYYYPQDSNAAYYAQWYAHYYSQPQPPVGDRPAGTDQATSQPVPPPQPYPGAPDSATTPNAAYSAWYQAAPPPPPTSSVPPSASSYTNPSAPYPYPAYYPPASYTYPSSQPASSRIARTAASKQSAASQAPVPYNTIYTTHPVSNTASTTTSSATSNTSDTFSIAGTGKEMASKKPVNPAAIAMKSSTLAKQKEMKQKMQELNLNNTAAPEYTVVNAADKKKANTKPGVLDNPMSQSNWPDSLKEYVTRVFEACPAESNDQVEAELRQMIINAHAAGTLWTTSWEYEPLPAVCQQHLKLQKKAAKRKALSEGIEDAPEELERRAQRLKRFRADESLLRSSPKSTPPPPPVPNDDVIDWDEYTIVGTSTELEKKYLRLTSAPNPATVRPLPVLKKTLELLKKKWRTEQNYAYICDQFKSMRQDLTVQRIKNDFTVLVYEIHARIALEKGDLGEYNQCQTQLRQLYAYDIPGHRLEFTAYRLLYLLYSRNYGALNAMMSELSDQDKSYPAIQHALDVRSALATVNYHRFFRLYLDAPNMGGYLMDHSVERERIESLKIMCRAFRPTLSLEYLTTELAFQNVDELLKFLQDHHAPTTKDALDTKAAYPHIHEAAKKYEKIDIKGQI